jgi:hypothetical protein
LTVQTAHVTFTGAEEIRRMFVDFFAEWESMVHTVTNLVVDVEAGTVATEQHVDLIAGATTAMHNCNFFTVVRSVLGRRGSRERYHHATTMGFPGLGVDLAAVQVDDPACDRPRTRARETRRALREFRV